MKPKTKDTEKKSYFYAELDEESKVRTVCQLTGPVSKGNMVALDSYDESLIGQTYNGTTFAPGDALPDLEPAKPTVTKTITTAGINWSELQKSDLGKALTLLVSLWAGISVEELTGASSEG